MKGTRRFTSHCQKAEKECKYWLDRRNFGLEEAFSLQNERQGQTGSPKDDFRQFRIHRKRVGKISGEKAMKKYHDVKKVRFEKHKLLLRVDGKEYLIDLRQYSKKLAAADERTKMNFEISPSGYGIHWPDLDEDLSIDGMIKSTKVKKAS
jgi:hypothetical protein